MQSEMKVIKPSSASSTYVSKKFSPLQSYSPDAEKPFLSVPSCLFSGSDSLSLDLAVVLWTSRRKQKGFGGGKTHLSNKQTKTVGTGKRHEQSDFLGEKLRELRLFSLEKRRL